MLKGFPMTNATPSHPLTRVIVRLLSPLLLASLFVLWPLALYAANITVDGATCLLTDAIEAANTDQAVGGCTTGSNTDTLLLTAPTYVFNTGIYADPFAPSDLSATPLITT